MGHINVKQIQYQCQTNTISMSNKYNINVKQIHKLLYQYHFLFRYFCCLVNLNVLFVLSIFNTSGS